MLVPKFSAMTGGAKRLQVPHGIVASVLDGTNVIHLGVPALDDLLANPATPSIPGQDLQARGLPALGEILGVVASWPPVF